MVKSQELLFFDDKFFNFFSKMEISLKKLKLVELRQIYAMIVSSREKGNG